MGLIRYYFIILWRSLGLSLGEKIEGGLIISHLTGLKVDYAKFDFANNSTSPVESSHDGSNQGYPIDGADDCCVRHTGRCHQTPRTWCAYHTIHRHSLYYIRCFRLLVGHTQTNPA